MVRFVILIILLILSFSESRAELPQKAKDFYPTYKRIAQHYFGDHAVLPMAYLGAQTHQESHWKTNAVSWAGAKGAHQIMDGTANWFTAKAGLGKPKPYELAWSAKFQCAYLDWILSRSPANTYCEKMTLAFGESNGGGTWLRRDIKLAKSKGLYPYDYRILAGVNAGRSESAKRENNGYMSRIMRVLAPLYNSNGWEGELCYQ